MKKFAAALPLVGFGVVVGQILYAGHRRDLPSCDNQDPSGRYGNPSLPRLDIVVLGDSSVTGPCVDQTENIWIGRVARHLSDRHHVVVKSVAVGGAKARDVCTDQLSLATAMDADIAFVSVGANDAIRATPLRRFERDYETIITALKASATHVVACGVGDLGTIPRLPTIPSILIRRRARAFDKLLATLASRHSIWKTDAWSGEFTKFGSGDPELFGADRFHASDEGHAIFASGAIPVVEQILRS